MKITTLILIVTAPLAFAQTRTVTVNSDNTLVSPPPQAFASANDLPRLSSNNTFSADNAFSGGLKAGDLHWVEALDEIFTIGVNGSAADLNTTGVELYTDFGDTIRVIEDSGSYYWSDEWNYGWLGRSGPWGTAEEGAAALRSFIPGFDPNWNGEYPYATSGEGDQCTVSVSARDLSDWSSSDPSLLPVTSSQQGRLAAWEGSGALISQSGNITLSGTLTSLSAPPSPPLLVTDSSAFTNVTQNSTPQGFALAGGNYPLLGMWTDQGQQCMVIGFGGHPELGGDNTFSRPWVPVNSDFIGEIGYFGTQGDFIFLSKSSSNPNDAVSWSFNFTGRSTVAGDTMVGQFSSRSIAFDNVEPGSKNPGVSYWSGTTAVIWNANIGTNKRELRMKFFGSPSSGYGNRDPLATRVIASTEWTASRWRGTGTTDPTTPQDGDLFFRSDTAKVRIYASGSWRDLN